MRPIDADAIVDYLDDELLNECFSGQEISAEDAVRMALRKVLDAPTLDVAPVVHAKWVGRYDNQGDYYYTCSNCEQNSYYYEEDEPTDALLPFCECCGAKMEVESEDCEEDDPQTV